MYIGEEFFKEALKHRSALFKINKNMFIENISIDSRRIKQNSMFIALCGKKFDGHNFVNHALKNKAILIMVEFHFKNNLINKYKNFVFVDNTLLALQDIAKAYLATKNILTIVLTGSNGKTTTKELIKASLMYALDSKSIFVSSMNLNNNIGVSINIFNITDTVNIAVFEVGISNFGELSPILNIINPKIALLCNIGNAHSGNLGGIKGVIKEKSVLSRKLAYDAMLVYNSDDQKSVSIAKIFNGKKLTFGYTLNSDMQILNMKTDIIDINAIDKVLKFKSTASIKYKHNIIKIYLNLPGKHNLFNAIAAATVCIACNVDLKMAILGMRKVVSLTGRGNVNCLKNGAFIINDSYNSNPESMISSLKIFTYIINARCIAVIGDMLEIYNPEIQHQNIGIYCAKSNVKLLFVYGRYASDIIIGALKAGFNLENIIHVNNLKKLSEKLNNIIKKNDVILIKGSRKLKMETILENLNDLYVI